MSNPTTTHTVTLRLGRGAPNANGHFVQNEHGATVAGPFETHAEAWTEIDRRVEPVATPAKFVPMTEAEFAALKVGDKVLHRSSSVYRMEYVCKGDNGPVTYFVKLRDGKPYQASKALKREGIAKIPA